GPFAEGATGDLADARPWSIRFADHDARIWLMGCWRRWLGIRLGAAGRRRVFGHDAACTRTRSQLDRYRGGVWARSFRDYRRPTTSRAALRPAPAHLHQMRARLGRKRSDDGTRSSADTRVDPARM